MKRFVLCSSGVYPDVNTIIFDSNNSHEALAIPKWDYIDSFDTEEEACGELEKFESQATTDYYKEKGLEGF